MSGNCLVGLDLCMYVSYVFVCGIDCVTASVSVCVIILFQAIASSIIIKTINIIIILRYTSMLLIILLNQGRACTRERARALPRIPSMNLTKQSLLSSYIIIAIGKCVL